jgi:TRAP-type C4-dicarboxylate transport system substrate-binding protein
MNPEKIEYQTLSNTKYSINQFQNGRVVNKEEILDLIANQDIEMAQMYTYKMRKFNTDLDVLDMPFIFRDHEHANRVFEGPIGQELLQSYSKNNTKIQGLAFTYSGGFKNVPSTRGITSLAEFQGVRVRTSNSPVSRDTWEAVGATPVSFEIEDLGTRMGDGTVDGGECTWPRFYHNGTNDVADTVLETNHNLLLTNIIINTDFLNSLDKDAQAVIKDCAIQTGRYEREISIDDVGPTSDQAKRDGIKVVGLSPEDESRFRDLTKVVYEKYKNQFSNDLISRIINS